jgi:hypothetical protein
MALADMPLRQVAPDHIDNVGKIQPMVRQLPL